jgi:S-(hydroxymethyl)glutathione dehydrogenase/alcohol dehydrogenase
MDGALTAARPLGPPPPWRGGAAYALAALTSGDGVGGAPHGGWRRQVLRDTPRFPRLAQSGRPDLGALVSRHIAFDEVNDGIEGLERAEGVGTVIV